MVQQDVQRAEDGQLETPADNIEPGAVERDVPRAEDGVCSSVPSNKSNLILDSHGRTSRDRPDDTIHGIGE